MLGYLRPTIFKSLNLNGIKMDLTPPSEIIITKADQNICLGSGELQLCPFCGGMPMSSGKKTPNGKAFSWTILCTRMKGSWPECAASVWGTDTDPDKARAMAVARWNRRHGPNSPVPAWEIASLKKTHDKWYDTHYSIIFTPPGEVPQTKGPWNTFSPVEEMIEGLKGEYSAETTMLVVGSRCGDLWVQEANEWLHFLKIQGECAEAEAAYIKAGVCSDCGACSAKEAETKCRQTPVGDTGEYGCAGENLWQDGDVENDSKENTEVAGPDPVQ